MELIEGETLGSRLRRGPLDPRDVYNILGQLLSAVGYAHAGKNGGNEGENTEEAAEEPAEEAAAADETPVHNEEN